MTDAERRARGWLRAGERDRFRDADPWVGDGLVRRGLILRAGSRPAER